jgi:hypothetical protein
MHRERAVERDGSRPRAPDAAPDGLHLLHRLDRDVAKGVVEEMRQREGEEDQPRDQAPGLSFGET